LRGIDRFGCAAGRRCGHARRRGPTPCWGVEGCLSVARQPRGASAVRSCRTEVAIRGVFDREESGRRSAEARGRGCGVSGESVARPPWSGRTGAGGHVDHDRSDDAGADDAGDQPQRSPVQPATVCTPPCAGSGRQANPGAVGAGGCCCVLPGLERAHDLLGSRSVASRHAESVATVTLPAGLQFGERRAVDGEVVGQAERQRGEVLLRVGGRGQPGRGLSAFALIAASASVLERPGPVGTLGDWSVPYSAVVSHHRHPNRNSTTII